MKFNLGIYRFLSSLVVFFLTVHVAYAHLPARLSLNGYTSDYTVGEADFMLPIKGNTKQNFYVNPQLTYGSDKQNIASLGVGYRWLHNAKTIYGTYLFGSYAHIANNARLWVINPGIEVLGRRWDAHLNGYIPIGDRRYSVWSTGYYFAGNSLYAANLHAVQEVGNGADVKLGYQLSSVLPFKAYVGSYFFSPVRTANIVGGTIGGEYWLDSFCKLFSRYSYDNLHHNTVAIGVGLEWGGTHLHRINPALRERLTDPVDHYFANLGYGAAMPSRKTKPQMLSSNTVYDNIAFFSAAPQYASQSLRSSLGSCTYENPCGPADFDQQKLNTLNKQLPNTQLYFNGGVFTALDNNQAITLNSGQSIYGTTADYYSPAAGNARTQFNGGFILQDNTAVTNIILNPADEIEAGFSAETVKRISIINSQIGNPNARFDKGIELNNVTGGIIDQTSVFAKDYAIELKKSQTISIQSSQISTVTTAGQSSAWGIATESSQVNIADSQIYVAGNSNSGRNTGIDVIDSQIIIKGTSVCVGSSVEQTPQLGVAISGDSHAWINSSLFNVMGASKNTGIQKETAGGSTSNRVKLTITNTSFVVGTLTSVGQQNLLELLPKDEKNHGSFDMDIYNSNVFLQGTDVNSLAFFKPTKNNRNPQDSISLMRVTCIKNGKISRCE